jgi:hypothetical protein
LLGYR